MVATLGSAGDLHPFLAVARVLQERGEEVVLLSQEPHRAEVEAQGVRFDSIASSAEHARTMSHPGLWHPIGGFGVLWRHLALPAILPTLLRLQRLSEVSSGPVVVLASPLVVGARIAAEAFANVHLTTGHTAPAGLRSCEDPMFMGAQQVPFWVPRLVRQQIWRWLDKYKLEPMAAPRLNAIRTEIGLAPIEGPVFGRWLHSPYRVMAMFPPAFGPMPSDWPVAIEFAGFPLYESTTGSGDSAGPGSTSNPSPDLVFYLGSAPTRQAQRLVDTAVSLAASGRRCMLLGPNCLTLPPLAPNVHTRLSTHLPSILSRASCFIHHGGIGSIAQGFAAGIPQVAVASAYDQFDNAWRLRKVGGQTGRVVDLSEEIAAAESSWLVSEQSLCQLELSKPNQPNAAVQRIVDRLMQDSRD